MGVRPRRRRAHLEPAARGVGAGGRGPCARRLPRPPPELLPRPRAAPRALGPRLAGAPLHPATPLPARPRARAARAGTRHRHPPGHPAARALSQPATPTRQDAAVRPVGCSGPVRARPPRAAVGARRPPRLALPARLRRIRQLARRELRPPDLGPHRVRLLPQVCLPVGAGPPARRAVALLKARRPAPAPSTGLASPRSSLPLPPRSLLGAELVLLFVVELVVQIVVLVEVVQVLVLELVLIQLVVEVLVEVLVLFEFLEILFVETVAATLERPVRRVTGQHCHPRLG